MHGRLFAPPEVLYGTRNGSKHHMLVCSGHVSSSDVSMGVADCPAMSFVFVC